MKHLKCLFALVLSVGMVSSAFSQGDPQNCILGVYVGNSKFKTGWGSWNAPIYPFEMEVGYKSAGARPAEAIFLFNIPALGQFCTLYTGPRFGSRENSIIRFDRESSLNQEFRKEDIENVSAINYIYFEPSSTCEEAGVHINKSFWDKMSVYGYKTSRSPRSYNELKRICNSLPEPVPY